jgi:hypothetical protein
MFTSVTSGREIEIFVVSVGSRSDRSPTSNLAAANGAEGAVELRDELAAKMSAAQITEAQRLAFQFTLLRHVPLAASGAAATSRSARNALLVLMCGPSLRF